MVRNLIICAGRKMVLLVTRGSWYQITREKFFKIELLYLDLKESCHLPPSLGFVSMKAS